jgi:hypothetical protein
MNRRQRILHLRVSFWLGAVIDAVAAVQLMLPELWMNFYGLSAQPDPVLTFGLVMGASLMWGWTALLVWADRKPLERKGILLLTIFPVVFGLVLNNVYSVASGLLNLQYVAPTLLLQCVVSGFMMFSYFNARKESP